MGMAEVPPSVPHAPSALHAWQVRGTSDTQQDQQAPTAETEDVIGIEDLSSRAMPCTLSGAPEPTKGQPSTLSPVVYRQPWVIAPTSGTFPDPFRYKMVISYYGGAFHGWQKQHPPGQAPLYTVQEVPGHGPP